MYSPQNNSNTKTSDNGVDVLFQWGNRKKGRVSRAAIEDSSSCVHNKNMRISSTVAGTLVAKLSSASMQPPPFVSSSAAASNGRATKHSPRNLEDPSAAGNDSPSRNIQGSSNPVVAKSAAPKLSPSCMEKSNRRMPSSTTQAFERLNNSHGNSASVQSEHEVAAVPTAPANGIVWPRIYIALSRKEKEDDFLAMKGTKIPQRPKKRAKNIDRSLQYCFPGMWLSDLTKSRYEVREKKSVKKQKRSRGLKGMESLDSDSEKLSTQEKKILGAALTKLSPENLTKALEIVAENNPSFKFASEEVDLDIDAQSDYTLWKLKVFVKDALEVQGTSAGDVAVNRNDNADDKTNNSKRRRQICDSIAKTNAKRTRKLSTL